MAFPIPVWKQKIQELKEIRETSKPAPDPALIPKPISKPAPSFPVSPVKQRIQEVQQIKPVEKAPVPYKPDAPYTPPKEQVIHTPEGYYKTQQAKQAEIEALIKQTEEPPKDIYQAMTQEHFFPGETTRYRKELDVALTQQKGITEGARLGVLDWHPKTKITQTKKGFSIDFPYAGAEKYYTHKKAIESDPGRAAALGFGWGGLGNVDIALYRMTGQEEKALESQIKQLHRYSTAKQLLAAGDVGGFSKAYWTGWLSMPTTQIALAASGGSLISSAAPKLSGAAAAMLGKTGMALGKTAVYGAGAGLLTVGAMPTVLAVKEGDYAKAAGRGWLFGTSITSAIAGAQTVSTATQTKSYLKSLDKAMAKKGITDYTITLKSGKLVKSTVIKDTLRYKGARVDFDRHMVQKIDIYKPGKGITVLTRKEAISRMAPYYEQMGTKYSKLRGAEVFDSAKGEFRATQNLYQVSSKSYVKVIKAGKHGLVEVRTKTGGNIYKQLSAMEASGRPPSVSYIHKSMTKFSTIKKSIIKSKEATGRLVPPTRIHKTITIPGITGKVPVFAPSFAGVSGMLGGAGTTGILGGIYKTSERKPIFIPEIKPTKAILPFRSSIFGSRFISGLGTGVIPELTTSTIQGTSTITIPGRATLPGTTTIPIVTPIIKTTPITETMKPVIPIKTIIPGIPFPAVDLFGRGRGSYDEAARKKKYKFRKFDIGGII